MFSHIQQLSLQHSWLIPTFMGILGALIGSFLNVCIDRWPKNESAISPRSCCEACGAPIAWYNNIPVLSFFILRGRCASCKAPFSSRHWILELFTGIIFAGCALWMSFPQALVGCLFAAILIIGAVIDWKHFTIPDACSMGGAGLGIVCAGALGAYQGDLYFHLLNSLFGLCVGSAVLLWMSLFAEKALKKPAVGFGDVLLLGMIGAFVGPVGAVATLLLGSVIGSLLLIPIWILEKGFNIRIAPRALPESLIEADAPLSAKEEDLRAGIAIPFGPWLAAAGFVIFFVKNIAVHNSYLLELVHLLN